jgi:hypothetical protein
MANVATVYTPSNAVRSEQSVLTLVSDSDYSMPENYAREVGVLLVDPSTDGGTTTITYPRAVKGRMITVKNTGTANSVLVKVTGQTGVTIPISQSAILLDNGTDFTVIGVMGYQS